MQKQVDNNKISVAPSGKQGKTLTSALSKNQPKYQCTLMLSGIDNIIQST